MTATVETMKAADAIGLPVVLTLVGPVEQDDIGIYIPTDRGKFRLDPDDLVKVPALGRFAS